jgi:YbgC/YbaW family acyl-CoA thioester hydrolase
METITLVKEPTSFYKIRFNDCDPFGHLNNARYVDYFLNAREDHLADHYQFSFTRYIQQGYGWVVAGHEIVYLKPANAYEKVCIQTSVIDSSDTQIVVEAIMFDEKQQQVKAVQWSRFVFVNLKTGKKDKHPEDLAALIAQLKNDKVDASAGLKQRLSGLLTKVI